MKKVRIEQILPNGRYLCADGQIYSLVGTRPPSIGEQVWTDGAYIIGYHHPRQLALFRRTYKEPEPDICLWGDRGYAIPSGRKTVDNSLCVGLSHLCDELGSPYIRYVFSNTIDFCGHQITIVQQFWIYLTRYGWFGNKINDYHSLYINQTPTDRYPRRMWLLCEGGVIEISDGDYWLDEESRQIKVISLGRSFTEDCGVNVLRSYINQDAYSPDGILIHREEIHPDETILNQHCWNPYCDRPVGLDSYRYVIDSNGNICAILKSLERDSGSRGCPHADAGYCSGEYYRTTWSAFPEGWGTVRVGGEFENAYYAVFEKDIITHEAVITKTPITKTCRCDEVPCVNTPYGPVYVAILTSNYNWPDIGQGHTQSSAKVERVQTTCCSGDGQHGTRLTYYFGSRCGIDQCGRKCVIEDTEPQISWEENADDWCQAWPEYAGGCAETAMTIYGCDGQYEEYQYWGRFPKDPAYILGIPYGGDILWFKVTPYYNYDTGVRSILIQTPVDSIRQDNCDVDCYNETIGNLASHVISYARAGLWSFESIYTTLQGGGYQFNYELRREGKRMDIELSPYREWILGSCRCIKKAAGS